MIGVARPGFYFPERDTLIWIAAGGAAAVARCSRGTARDDERHQRACAAAPRCDAGAGRSGRDGRGAHDVRPMAANLLFGVGGPPVVHVRSMVARDDRAIRPALLVLAAGVVVRAPDRVCQRRESVSRRGVARQRELAVRAAIGASRVADARASCSPRAWCCRRSAARSGSALAWTLVRLAPALAARDFPRLDAIRLDGRSWRSPPSRRSFTAIAVGHRAGAARRRFNLAESLHGGDGATRRRLPRRCARGGCATVC